MLVMLHYGPRMSVYIQSLSLSHIIQVATELKNVWVESMIKEYQDQWFPFYILGNLHIFNLTQADEGTYLCTANNGIGTQQVKAMELNVEG